MKPTSSLVAALAARLPAACSMFGSPEPIDAGAGAQGTNDVEWKEVTQTISGNVVTYKVPVSRPVASDMLERAVPLYGLQWKAARVAVANGAAGPPKTAGTHVAANSVTASAAPTYIIGLDAETAMAQAEIVARDAQSPLEPAQTALMRSRDAARSGDSSSIFKFSKTAQALVHRARRHVVAVARADR
ncbi:MAG: hypothetical protein ABI190_10275 [Casimicrobiaceae bacterium]